MAGKPEVIHMVEFEGVVFPAEQKAFGKAYPNLEGHWTPRKKDILKAERLLKKFLEDQSKAVKAVKGILKELKTYRRQYSGILIEGQQEIYFNFFCDEMGIDWKSKEVMGEGGPGFFSVKFSLKTSKFRDLIMAEK